MSGATDAEILELIDFVRGLALNSEDGARFMRVSSALSELSMLKRDGNHDWRDVYGEHLIPPTGLEILTSYVKHGVPPGDTWRAILSSNMREAFRLADRPTARAMAAISSYLYNKVPASCYGSARKVDQWIALHHMTRAFDVALQLTPDRRSDDLPQLCEHGYSPLARFVGARAGALRFQLTCRWQQVERLMPGALRIIFPQHSPAYVVDVEALEAPDADSVIDVKLSALRTGYE